MKIFSLARQTTQHLTWDSEHSVKHSAMPPKRHLHKYFPATATQQRQQHQHSHIPKCLQQTSCAVWGLLEVSFCLDQNDFSYTEPKERSASIVIFKNKILNNFLVYLKCPCDFTFNPFNTNYLLKYNKLSSKDLDFFTTKSMSNQLILVNFSGRFGFCAWFLFPSLASFSSSSLNSSRCKFPGRCCLPVVLIFLLAVFVCVCQERGVAGWVWVAWRVGVDQASVWHFSALTLFAAALTSRLG